MSAIIEKIKMINYKRFLSYTIYPNQKVNIIVGDNETGKSSVIEAIDLVSSGNVRKVETIGLDNFLTSKLFINLIMEQEHLIICQN